MAAIPQRRIYLDYFVCPGFTNRKYNDAFVVRVHHETDAVYHLQNFNVLEDSPESTRHIGDSQTSSRRIPAGHRSQSEADWAYVKRALARGDDPRVAIHRIADFRSEDKGDPVYYARLTVTKARTQLQRLEGEATFHQSFSVEVTRTQR